jgi:hypothetical protein
VQKHQKRVGALIDFRHEHLNAQKRSCQTNASDETLMFGGLGKQNVVGFALWTMQPQLVGEGFLTGSDTMLFEECLGGGDNVGRECIVGQTS